MARERVNSVSPYAGRATEKLAVADAKVREATARARAAEGRADAADERAQRLEAALERIGERLDAIERGMERKAPVKIEMQAPSVFECQGDHLQHWPAIGTYMGLSAHAVRHLAKTAGLPTYKIGKTVAASKTSIDRWRASRADATPAP